MSDMIDVNQLSNALQQKVDLPSGKSQADIDYVVESQLPTAENNYTWYRLYKSGWIEQGGFKQETTTSGNAFDQTITLPKTMKDTNYTVLASAYRADNFVSYNGMYTGPTTYCTTTTVRFQLYGLNTSQYINGVKWEVKGMSAQS